jgi:hypothetical protein
MTSRVNAAKMIEKHWIRRSTRPATTERRFALQECAICYCDICSMI